MNILSDSLWLHVTLAHQAPLFMGFPGQEYWSRWPFPSPGDLPDPGVEPVSPVLQADSLPSELLGTQTQILLKFKYCSLQ